MKTLVILSAKYVEKELQNRFGKIPPVLIPFENKCSIDYIYSAAKKTYDKIIIVGFEGINLIKNYISKKDYNIELISLDKLGDIGYSFSKVELSRCDNITILFGDTLLKEFNFERYSSGSTIGYSLVEDTERWTTFIYEEEKLKIYDKEELETCDNQNCFIGIFNFDNLRLLQEILDSHHENSSSMDSFYSLIMAYSNKEKIKFIEEKGWLDLGHEDKYFGSKKDVEARYFNTIEVDKRRGILKKSSLEKEKFINEIKWYLKLPAEIQYVAPRIFDYSLDYNEPFVKMEYYAYNTIHELFLWGNYSKNKWKEIFKTLFETHKEFSKYKLELERHQIKKMLKEIYLDKTVQRLKSLKKDQNFIKYFQDEISVNNFVYPSLEAICEKLDEILEVNKLYWKNNLSIIHGDYFFANILYDNKCNMVRVIDPRGDFGGYGIYGDPSYDLAKLSHSVDGKYDFIVEDLFRLEENKTSINYKILSDDKHEEIKDLFYNILSSYDDIRRIKLIQALLFLSMIPLHKDFPKRQKVMLATGLELIKEFL